MSFIDKALGGRYSKVNLGENKYTFDKLIFVSIVFFLLFSSVAILFANNFDKSNHIYVKCTDSYKCFNPYFNNTQVCGSYIPLDNYLCTTEYLPSNYEYGKPSPWYVEYFYTISVGLVALGLLFNHLKYNRGNTNV